MASNTQRELILTSSPDGPITAYDSSTRAMITRFAPTRCPTRGLALAGRHLVATAHVCPVTASGSIRLYKWWSATAFHNLPLPEPVAPLAATPDGSFLFAGSLSRRVYVVSVPSGDILRSLPPHCGPVSCLVISEDGSLLISGGVDGTIVVIPIFELVKLENKNADKLTMHRFGVHSGSVTAIRTGKGQCSSMIISSLSDCTCKFWSLLRGTHLRTVEFPCPILGVVLSPSESEFYAAGSDRSVYTGSVPFRARRGKREVVRWRQSHCGSIVSVEMVDSGRFLVSASEDGSVWVRRLVDGEVVSVLGTEMRSRVSDLVVAHGTSSGKGLGLRLSGGVGLCKDREVVNGNVKETMEIEGVLTVAEDDRIRAIEMLESAIVMYKKLLELILKESKGGNSTR